VDKLRVILVREEAPGSYRARPVTSFGRQTAISQAYLSFFKYSNYFS
jgi:hypothetical protein